MVGHSIGGWVARAYLGGLGQTSTAVHRLAVPRVSSLITLGTPHTSPDTALVDQTRGLLAAVAAAPSCTPQALVDNYSNSNNRARKMQITCVGSGAVPGNFFTTNLEEFVAASSYLPLLGLTGNGDNANANAGATRGDGIVPLELALGLDAPAGRVELNACSVTQQPIRHAHVLPTPWNLLDGSAASIPLSTAGNALPSYVSSAGVVHQWANYIR